MSTMDKRLSKLEQVHGGGVQDRLFVVMTALGPGPHEPIGLSQGFSSGRFFPRLPGESVDALHARAVRDHPSVLVWVHRYEECESDTKSGTASMPEVVPKSGPLDSPKTGTAFINHHKEWQ